MRQIWGTTRAQLLLPFLQNTQQTGYDTHPARETGLPDSFHPFPLGKAYWVEGGPQANVFWW